MDKWKCGRIDSNQAIMNKSYSEEKSSLRHWTMIMNWFQRIVFQEMRRDSIWCIGTNTTKTSQHNVEILQKFSYDVGHPWARWLPCENLGADKHCCLLSSVNHCQYLDLEAVKTWPIWGKLWEIAPHPQSENNWLVRWMKYQAWMMIMECLPVVIHNDSLVVSSLIYFLLMFKHIAHCGYLIRTS